MKNLGLVLAAGKGSRVEHLLDSDEVVKPMLKIKNNRLIDFSLEALEKLDVEGAVLSYPSSEYEELDKRVKECGFKVLKQKAEHRKVFYLFELPRILLTQYHRSCDSGYLRSFDNILTIPSDLILEGVDLEGMLEFHMGCLRSPRHSFMTMIKRAGIFVFSKGLLKHPLGLIGNIANYEAGGGFVDYGDPDMVRRLKNV